MIELKALNKKELLKYIAHEQFGLGKHIPITRHRAKSQALNPRADQDDILLILAIDNGDLAGYLGVLPDYLFSGSRKEKIGWFSCLWVSPDARGKGISLKLMQAGLEYWDNKILSADYVPFTKKIYHRTEAFRKEPYTKSGVRLYLRSDLYQLLPPKSSFFSNIKGILKIKDAFFNIFLDLKLSLFKPNIDEYSIETFEELTGELSDFISNKKTQSGFQRTTADLNWILKNPWVLNNDQDDGLSEKYHFSSVANEFQFKPICVKDQNKNIVAILIFAKRDGTLKLPYLFHRDQIQVVADIVNYLLVEWKIKTFTSFHPELCTVLKRKPTPAFYIKSQQRSYMVSHPLESILFDQNMVVQDGDGDCCFT